MNSSHAVLFRYDSADEKLTCASCTVNTDPAGDACLAENGLSLTNGPGLLQLHRPSRPPIR